MDFSILDIFKWNSAIQYNACINRIISIQYLSFCDSLISLSIISSRFIHDVVCGSISFQGWIIFHCMAIPHFALFIHQLMDSWWATFGLLWIVLLWIFVYKFLCGHVFSVLLGMYLGLELLGHVVTLKFNILRNCQTIFQSACFILQSHQQCMGLLICAAELLSCFYSSWWKP